MKNVYCIYHNADFDGIGSAAVVNYYHKELKDKVYVYGYNFGQKIPDYDSFDKNGIVYMVDVCLPYEDMQKLLKIYGDRFVWIDHHITAKNDMANLKINTHINLEQAAIQNCWEYFYPHIKFPYLLQLIANHDIWKISDESFQLNHALFSNPEYKKPRDPLWKQIIEDNEETINQLMHDGKIIQTYNNEVEKKIIQSAHLVKLAGETVPALNSNLQGSGIFERQVKNLYEKYAFIVIYYKVITGWKISLFSNRKDINLPELTKEYGFKGHKKACGAMLNELPFEYLNLPIDRL